MKKTCLIVSVLACAGLIACDSEPAQQASPTPTDNAPAVQSTPTPTPAPTEIQIADIEPVETDGSVQAMGVTFPLPVGWASAPPSNSMRLAEVRVPDSSGDSAMECVIAISSAGGSVDGNITRWGGQVRQEDGSATVPQPTVMTASGMRVTIVELVGEYVGMGVSEAFPDWMLRGAIIETPRGLLFVKMTGPAEPMRQAGPGFRYMVAAMSAQ